MLNRQQRTETLVILDTRLVILEPLLAIRKIQVIFRNRNNLWLNDSWSSSDHVVILVQREDGAELCAERKEVWHDLHQIIVEPARATN